jgi:hypothetical protein
VSTFEILLVSLVEWLLLQQQRPLECTFGWPSSPTNSRNRSTMAKIKVHELRTKNKTELLKQLEELKNELAQLRVAKVRNMLVFISLRHINTHMVL